MHWNKSEEWRWNGKGKAIASGSRDCKSRYLKNVDAWKNALWEATERETWKKKRIEKAEAEKTEIEKKKNQLYQKAAGNSRWSHVEAV